MIDHRLPIIAYRLIVSPDRWIVGGIIIHRTIISPDQ
jgi:hypothetical protein